jgi:nitrile hydratase subunit beta
MKRPHDLGGEPAGPIDTSHKPEDRWQILASAIYNVLCQPDRRLIRVDSLRRAIEDIGPDYHRLGYFDRVVEAMQVLLEEKGILSRAETVARMELLRARSASAVQNG